MKPVPCPKCGCEAEATTGIAAASPQEPRPHDVSVCFFCATVLEFDQALQLRALTGEEIERLDPDLRDDLDLALAIVELARETGGAQLKH